MSRNNLIGVLRVGRHFVVLSDLNADLEWSRRRARYLAVVKRRGARYDTRAAALVAAHDMQKVCCTEYGVREL